jgi:tRNA pseudouridine38-40 synthase
VNQPEPRALLLTLEYDGSAYVGWQLQKNGLSVQAVLEEAAFQVCGARLRVRAASRTDSGVHARGQVALLPWRGRLGPAQALAALNARLPEDVCVRAAAWAEPGFQPRRRAQGKLYRYLIHNAQVRPVLERRMVWHLRHPLDIEGMNRAAEVLVGQHDFSAFRAANCPARSPIRRLDRLEAGRDGERVWIVALGPSFLKQMVRNLVGCLAEVGRGRLTPPEVAVILAGRARTRAPRTAPAQGLCLERVFFEPEAYRRALHAAY